MVDDVSSSVDDAESEHKIAHFGYERPDPREAVPPLLADITREALAEAREHQHSALRERERELRLSIAKLDLPSSLKSAN